MPLYYRDQNGAVVLTAIQVDANWRSLYGPPAALQIINGVLDVTAVGQGTYTVRTQGDAATDEVQQIIGLPTGQELTLSAFSALQVVTFLHTATLRLAFNGMEFSLGSEYSTIVLKSHNGVIVKEIHRAQVP